MNVETGRETGVDVVEEPQELLMPVPSVAVADRDSAGHIQGRKQRRNPVPFVIMRLPDRYAGSQR
jgi:hypothetical protein